MTIDNELLSQECLTPLIERDSDTDDVSNGNKYKTPYTPATALARNSKL